MGNILGDPLIQRVLDAESVDARRLYKGVENHVDLVHQEDSESIDKHYKFMFRGYKLDPYRIFSVYNITNAAQQHAIKKLLRAGNSIKSFEQDIKESISTLNRLLEILEEDKGEYID